MNQRQDKKLMSEETKRKIGLANSISLKGKIIPLEVRQKISKTLSGKGHGFKKGHISWNKGITGYSTSIKGTKRSVEFCKKISEAQLGKPKPSKKGNKHHFWKGGVTPLRSRIWHSWRYKNWRINIFKKDNYICQICGVRGNYLEADHYPIPFVFFIRQISKLYKENIFEHALEYEPLWKAKGRTLCRECHNKTKWGRATLRVSEDERRNL